MVSYTRTGDRTEQRKVRVERDRFRREETWTGARGPSTRLHGVGVRGREVSPDRVSSSDFLPILSIPEVHLRSG